MNTNIKKKGRIAMAWLIIITMVFATMSTPFAYAVDSTTYPSGNTFSNFQTVDKEDLTSTSVPASADFIFIKQASGQQDAHYLWTPMEITDNQLKADILQYVRDNDNSMKNDVQYPDSYWATFDNFIWGYDGEAGTFNDSPYGFTLEEIEGMSYTVIQWESGKISHIDFGDYEQLSATAQIVLTKALVGNDIEDYSGKFGFELVETDSTWEPLEGATPATAYNDADGNITFPSVTYKTLGTHYYQATEVPGSVLGVTYDADPINIQVAVGMDGDVLKAVVTVVSEKKSFTNTYEEEEFGSINVTKTVTVPGGATLTKPMTFTFALFDDQGNRYTEYEPLEITVNPLDPPAPGNPDAVTGTFTGLDLEKTYNVYEVYQDGEDFLKVETDNEGNVITAGIPWKSMTYTNNEDIEVNSETAAEVTVNNVLPSEEGGLTGSIEVVKTVTVNNKPFASNLTFYVGLFEDEELTILIDKQALVMNGKTETSVTFEELDAGLYYIAETDKDGNPLTGTAKDLGFEIQINGDKTNISAVELIEDEMLVNLVNNFKKEEFPLTGDNSNMNLWLFLAMLGVAGAIAPFAFGKKEKAND